MEFESTFGQWVKQRRRALDLTQDELAQKVGCSKSAIRKIETDERRPSRQIAGLLAECLEIPAEERAIFLRVARSELSVSRLGSIAGSEKKDTLSRLGQVKERATFTAVETPARTPNQPAVLLLPSPGTPLVGREPELAQVMLLLSNPQCRLLTLTGQGGIGKTRLAIQAITQFAAQQPGYFQDGIYFVPLAGIASAENIIPAIADRLSFSFYGSMDVKTQLVDYLRGKKLLIILDNMEHLLSGAEFIAEILRQAPEVKFLVTSIELLNLHGEWVFEIQGLPVPPNAQVERLEEYSAVSLFKYNARRVRPEFELSDRNLPYVVRICELMDGLPLGIELAAAWVRVLSCQEIVAEIEHNLDFLATSLRDIPERHRSLRAAFDHSWKLLSEQEQQILRQLSVFRTGFHREAAEAVAYAGLPQLSTLVDKSLLRRTIGGRYDQHETMQKYAAQKLAEKPEEWRQVQERHSVFYLTRLAESQELLNQDQKVLEGIRIEFENIRTAWNWAANDGQIALLGASASAMGNFYRLSGLLKEGHSVFCAGVDKARRFIVETGQMTQEQGLNLGRLLAEQAIFSNERARYDQAIRAAQEAIELGEKHADALIQAKGHLEIGFALFRRDDFPAARLKYERALALSSNSGSLPLEATCLQRLGMISSLEQKLAEANTYFERSLQIYRQIGDRHGEGQVMNRIGSTFYVQGDIGRARHNYETALNIFHEIGDRRSEGRLLNNLGTIQQGQGDNFHARNYYAKSLAIIRETGDRWGESASLSNLGLVSHRLGDFDSARSYYEQAVQMCREIEEWGGETGAISNLGLLAYHEGDYHAAQAYQQEVLVAASKHTNSLIESIALSRLGRVFIALDSLPEAAAAFQKSLDQRREMGREYMGVEPLTGLAQVYALQGDIVKACTTVEQILDLLTHRDTNLFDTADDPCWVYLTCFDVLSATQDPRARDILETAVHLMHQQASKIETDTIRQMFLQNIPAHRAVEERWAQQVTH